MINSFEPIFATTLNFSTDIMAILWFALRNFGYKQTSAVLMWYAINYLGEDSWDIIMLLLLLLCRHKNDLVDRRQELIGQVT